MIVAFSVAPTEVPNAQAEMSEAVAAAIKIVRESGLPNETNAMFTLIEGEWDEVMSVVKRAGACCVAAGGVGAQGRYSPRVYRTASRKGRICGAALGRI